MDLGNSSSNSSNGDSSQRSVQEIVAMLTTPGQVMLQVTGWKNVCRSLEYSLSQEHDLFKNVSGIAFEVEGLDQVVNYFSIAEELKKKVLLGKVFKTDINSCKINNELDVNLLEGFDDLERRLNKAKIWGCDFVILQVGLIANSLLQSRSNPFDNSDYFGIFTSSVQHLGMVPIIQLKYDRSMLDNQSGRCMFIETMSQINKSLFDFEVSIENLIIGKLMRFPINKFKYSIKETAEDFVVRLQRALPPAIGGVVFFSEGSHNDHGFLLDEISKLIDRIPWPITCGHVCNVPAFIKPESEDKVLEKWFKREKLKVEMLSMANLGNLIKWEPKPTGITDEFVKSHDYYAQPWNK